MWIWKCLQYCASCTKSLDIINSFLFFHFNYLCLAIFASLPSEHYEKSTSAPAWIFHFQSYCRYGQVLCHPSSLYSTHHPYLCAPLCYVITSNDTFIRLAHFEISFWIKISAVKLNAKIPYSYTKILHVISFCSFFLFYQKWNNKFNEVFNFNSEWHGK